MNTPDRLAQQGRLRQAPFLRQGIDLEHGIKLLPVGPTVTPLVEAAARQTRIQCLRLGHQRLRYLHVMLRPLDLVVQDKLVLTLHHTHRNPQLHRTASLALRAPTRVWLKNGKHFLLVRYHLALQDAPVDLVNLPLRMFQITLDFLLHIRVGSVALARCERSRASRK